jgi:hypothetical protein
MKPTRVFAGLLVAALSSCRPPPVHDGPVVLITIDALRADALGALGGNPRLTPHLDRFARQADWAGPAVAPSSWTVPSMASLMTGLRPWSTGSLSADYAGLRPELTTLAEALRERAYRTTGFYSNAWLRPTFGYDQGFDVYQRFKPGRAAAHLETLGGGREFVWIHILPPHAPYLRHDRFLDRIDLPGGSLPKKVRAQDLETYFDPARPLEPSQRNEFRGLYDLHTAFADEIAGKLLGALERSGQFDRALVVVTSDHGEEFGEHGQIGHGGSLGRVLLEVPLLIKLPTGWTRRLDIDVGSRPGTVRVASTLLTAVGATLLPGAARGLFEPQRRGVLSELYQGNGVNQFSLVEGDVQLIWESRFAEPAPDYFRMRRVLLGVEALESGGLAPGDFFTRLRSSFAVTRPLSGSSDHEPRLELRHWRSGASADLHQDPANLRAMARRLKERWLEHHGPERLPGTAPRAPALDAEAIEELRALGYVGG